MKATYAWLGALGLLASLGAAHADTGKLPLTGGVSSITGTAGGGITPWAVIGTQATEGEIGVSAFASRAVTQDYSLNSTGVALGFKASRGVRSATGPQRVSDLCAEQGRRLWYRQRPARSHGCHRSEGSCAR